MADYDIGAAFKAIEDELIASMIRNMDRHRAEEDKEGLNWTMWQAEQLKALEKYKKQNQKRFGGQFKDINGQIAALLQQARADGNMQQEVAILNAIKNGFKGAKKAGSGAAAEFFRLNDRKLEALIKATTDDMERAETAVLRMANDQYRKAIFNAQVYANSGAGTYEKAVDMATKDMLAAGLNCVEYKNGARHTLSDYADMAIRTASKRAYLQGEGEKRQEWGIATVIVNKRGNPCPKCLPFCGKVLIDDVWSGGSRKDGNYPLMSTAVAAGLYHPRCKDSHTTYFPGISTVDDTWTKEELAAIGQANQLEAERQYAERQAEKFGRRAENSLSEENQKRYAARQEEWKRRGGEKANSQGTTPDDIEEYLLSKKQYDNGIKNLQTLQKENDDLFDAYNLAMESKDEKRLERLWEKKYDELESFKEVIKDLKAQLSGKEAKAVRQIEKNLADMLGIDSSNIVMTGMPYDSADMVYKAYNIVLDRYPELKGHLSKFVYDEAPGRTYAGCYAMSGKIEAHGIFKNYEKMAKSYVDDVAESFHPKGTDLNSIIVHELGHALDGYMTKQDLLGGGIKYGNIRRTSIDVEHMVLDRLGYFDTVKEIKETMRINGNSWKEIQEALSSNKKAFITEHISEYASDNCNEFFAECFAEYMMSDNPRDAARILGEIINEALGR